MFWFDLLFPPAMILFPVLFLTACRTPAGVTVDRDRVRRHALLLWLGTFVCLGVWGATFAWFGGDVGRHCWLLAAPLFAVMPGMLNAKNPDWSGQAAGAATRSASLVKRSQEPIVPRSVFAALWVVWMGGLAAVALRGLDSLTSLEQFRWWLALGGVALAMMHPWLAAFASRRVLEEPEPRDAAGSAELAEAYAGLRRFRAWGFVGMGAVMLVLTLGVSLMLAWMPEGAPFGPAVGIAGGVVGSLVGCGGAAFGVIASIRRVRITALLRRLEGRGDMLNP